MVEKGGRREKESLVVVWIYLRYAIVRFLYLLRPARLKVVITLNKSQTKTKKLKTVTVFFPSQTVLSVFVAKKRDFFRQIINIKKLPFFYL